MTLEDLRLESGLSKRELARQSGLDFNTVQRAVTGEVISLNTAGKIARALSKALNRNIRYQDIEGLNIGR
jgi:transcriptional regulator with XRE-family HTH domain